MVFVGRGPVVRKSWCGNPAQWDTIYACRLVHSVRAHQQPISALLEKAGLIVSASGDGTLKVGQNF
jgi:hypothetical protein